MTGQMHRQGKTRVAWERTHGSHARRASEVVVDSKGHFPDSSADKTRRPGRCYVAYCQRERPIPCVRTSARSICLLFTAVGTVSDSGRLFASRLLDASGMILGVVGVCDRRALAAVWLTLASSSRILVPLLRYFIRPALDARFTVQKANQAARPTGKMPLYFLPASCASCCLRRERLDRRQTSGIQRYLRPFGSRVPWTKPSET